MAASAVAWDTAGDERAAASPSCRGVVRAAGCELPLRAGGRQVAVAVAVAVQGAMPICLRARPRVCAPDGTAGEGGCGT